MLICNIFRMAKTSTYLAIYMLSFFLVGIPQSSIGVLIPFYSEDLGIQETEYSILFTMMSVSNLAACILYKAIESHNKLPIHHVVGIITSAGLAFFCFIMAGMTQRIPQCIILSILGMCWSILVMTVNICLLLAPPKEEIGFWMSISHGSYGVGALFGPIITAYIQQNVFIFLAIIFAALVPCFYLIESPELKQKKEELDNKETTKQMKIGSMKLEVLISLAFFILVGIQITIPGWIPSYAVLSGIETKQNAGIFTTIFWTLSTIFRFAFSWLKEKDSFKFSSLNLGQLITGIIVTLLAIWHYPVAATYLCSILYGISLSQLFPLLLSTPSEFNIKFQDKQISNMMISITVSSGVFSTPTGMLMKYDINMFYYSLLFFSLLLFACGRVIIDALKKQALGSQENSQEMKLLQQ